MLLSINAILVISANEKKKKKKKIVQKQQHCIYHKSVKSKTLKDKID